MAHFVGHPRTSVHNGNQQEVTGDKWMLTNVMSDGNYPSHSDFHGLCLLFLTLFYRSLLFLTYAYEGYIMHCVKKNDHHMDIKALR